MVWTKQNYCKTSRLYRLAGYWDRVTWLTFFAKRQPKRFSHHISVTKKHIPKLLKKNCAKYSPSVLHTTSRFPMPRETQLSSEKRAKISAFHEAGLSYCSISRHVNRSQNLVWAYISASFIYASKTCRQNRRNMTVRDKRHLFWAAFKSTEIAKALWIELKLLMSASRTRTYLSVYATVLFKRVTAQSPHTKIIRKRGRSGLVVTHAWTTDLGVVWPSQIKNGWHVIGQVL